jgi:hypothetical protein
MSKVIGSSGQEASKSLIAKLLKTGHLLPTLYHDPGAIAAAITRLKEDLRGGDDKSPKAT